jgi:hypothetical protein
VTESGHAALRVVRKGTLGPIRRDVAERWLASGDPGKVMYAILRLSLHGPDFAYAERMALNTPRIPTCGCDGTPSRQCFMWPG